MRRQLFSTGVVKAVCGLALMVLAMACAPPEVEPSLGGLGPATAPELPTPFPSPTIPASPQNSPTAWDPAATPALVSGDENSPPGITPTPFPPPPGLIYNLEGQLWQVGDDWQPELLAAEAGDVISADGQRALRVVENDIWLIYLPTGQRFNLTGNSGRTHCCPQFWPGRPDTIVFGSWSPEDDLGPSTGYLSSAKFDLSEYRVLDEAHLSNADGRQLAWTGAVTDPEWRIAVAVFDLKAGSAKLFHPYQNAGRGGWFPPPAWSPDGRWLAFVAEDADPEQVGVWVIDLKSGEERFVGRGIDPRWSPDGHWLLFAVRIVPCRSINRLSPTMAWCGRLT
jgi:hypothetical protein